MILSKQEFASKLGELFEEAKANRESMGEEELRIKFAKADVLQEAGYEEDNIFWEETLENQKRTDIHCKDDVGDFVVVFEFKKPSVESLEEHEKQLRERYVLPYKVDYGVLYNGLELIFYKRQGNSMARIFRTSADDVSPDRLDQMMDAIRKPDRSTTELDNVTAIDGKRFSKEEQIVIPLPRTGAAAEKALEMLAEDRQELEDGKTTEELEEGLNRRVFDLYDIDAEQQEVVQRFLGRF